MKYKWAYAYHLKSSSDFIFIKKCLFLKLKAHFSKRTFCVKICQRKKFYFPDDACETPENDDCVSCRSQLNEKTLWRAELILAGFYYTLNFNVTHPSVYKWKVLDEGNYIMEHTFQQ